MVYEQIRRRKKLLRMVSDYAFLVFILFFGGLILYHIIMFAIEQS
jgi:hypothetical protein